MKAYEIGEFGIENLKIVEREIPSPGPHDVVVRMKAASINYRDLMVIKGTYNPRMKLPAVPFSDCAGEVIEIGNEVSRFKPGDRVIPIFVQKWIDGECTDEKRRSAIGAGAQWDGVLREFAAFSEEGLVAVPKHLSYEEAAALPCAGITAWHALVESGRLKAGDSVLTLGSGGVSIFAIQIASMFGARVIATSSSNDKLGRLRELGAEGLLNYQERPDWNVAVMEMTAKRGVDHVVDVGGLGTLSRSILAARVGGHVAMVGALSTEGTFDPVSAFMRSIRLQGIFGGSRQMFEDMNRAIEKNLLRPVIDRVFGFDEVREALRHVESGAHFGKVVVTFQLDRCFRADSDEERSASLLKPR